MSEAKPLGRGRNTSHDYQQVPGYSPPIFVPSCQPNGFAYTRHQLLFRDEPSEQPKSWGQRCQTCFTSEVLLLGS